MDGTEENKEIVTSDIYSDQGIPKQVRWHKKFFARSDKEILENLLEMSISMPNASPDWAVTRVAHALGCSTKRVEEVVRKARLKEEVKVARAELVEKTYREKVPLLKEIVSLSLVSVRDWLLKLKSDPDRLHALESRDIRFIASIGGSLNDLLRLELGQPTERIEVNQVSGPPVINIVIGESQTVKEIIDVSDEIEGEVNNGLESLPASKAGDSPTD